MNNDILAGNWKQLKGSMLEQWGKLTGDDIDIAAGRRDKLVGKLQEHYGLGVEQAESEVRTFEQRYRSASADLQAACGHCSTVHPASHFCPTH